MSPYCKKIFSYDLHMSTNFRLLQFDQFHPILYNKISLDTHAKLGLHILLFSWKASWPAVHHVHFQEMKPKKKWFQMQRQFISIAPKSKTKHDIRLVYNVSHRPEQNEATSLGVQYLKWQIEIYRLTHDNYLLIGLR